MALTGLVFISASARAQSIESLPVKAGDTWVYKVKTRFGDKERQELIEDVGEKITLSVTGDKSETRILNKDGNLISVSNRTYSPYLEEFQFPLEPGKTWSQSSTLEANVRRLPVSLKAKVVGWEEVTVPAGTLKALRIDYDIFLGQVGSLQKRMWILPDVRRSVKVEMNIFGNINMENETVELIKFTPAK